MCLHVYVYIEMYVHFSYICGVKFFPEKENHLKENCIKDRTILKKVACLEPR